MNIAKKKILFVSVAFPPKNDPEGLQVAKYFHYLQKHKDLQIDVVTSALPTLYMAEDSSLQPYTIGINQLVNIELNENRYVNYLRHRFGFEETVFPDSKQSFHRKSDKVFKELKEVPDLIYSRAHPKSSTVLAYKLKQKFNVPWILHMSDPWADCPMHNFSKSYYKKNDEWERKCLESANIISLTSEPTIDFYKKKYPALAHKFRFYPNVYEIQDKTSLVENIALNNNRKFRLIYTGGLADTRSPEFILKPLNELYIENPDIANKVEVIFAGDVDSINRAVFSHYNLPFVNWIGRLSFNETLKLQKTADYLIAIDFVVEKPGMAMFFLSKLLDYMVARKRILTLTTKGSAADEVMKDLKGDVCAHTDVQSIKSAVQNALEAFKRRDNNYLINDYVPEKYEASYNADRLYEEMIELINNENIHKQSL